ncbi:hypothetical protein PMI28_02041 [Pseudomonas sp. GM48]|nr:hypothetical protein PMI28_02041 [Pseudomonas sp. GM48]
MKTLDTGATGFIDAHCVLRRLHDGHHVFGLDNFNSYYDPQFKHDPMRSVQEQEQAHPLPLSTVDLADTPAVEALFASDLAPATDFQPPIELDEELRCFAAWFLTND